MKRLFLLVLTVCCRLPAFAQEVPARTLELRPGKGNPRNSEGAFVTLKDGRILFIYSHFTAGRGDDHDPATLAARASSDGGRTWTKESRIMVRNEGNIMSASLLRLQNGEIALFYLVKKSSKDYRDCRDCRPVMRLSSDEGATWGAPVACVTDEVGYYVLNNDRVIQLKGGRLVAPVALHTVNGSAEFDWQGTVMCYLSDDNGRTWRRGKTARKGYDKAGKRVTLQEPGVVELKDGRLMMFMRTGDGCQYLSFSADGGDTWTPPAASDIKSPRSPASIKRIPSTGDLLLVWNDHTDFAAVLNDRRVPLSTAISKDDGKTWRHRKALEGNPQGRYCYIAIEPAADAVLLGYCVSGLSHTRVTRVPVSWLYADRPAGAATDTQALSPLFDAADRGPLKRLETQLGTWSAESGHAEVCGYARGKGIRILKGTNQTVVLTLPKSVSCGTLARLAVERGRWPDMLAPYVLTLEARVGDAWRRIGEQGEATQVGLPYKVKIQEPELQAAQFRFRCTSALGATLIDMPDINFYGFFND